LSRAFVKDDEDAERIKELFEQEKKLLDWLNIQKKKLFVLESGEKAGTIDEVKRKQWIIKTKKDIEDTEKNLERLREEIKGLQKG